MTDLLLIHPGAQHGIYGELGDQLTALEPPPWCRMIAGYIRNRDYSVEILDAEVSPIAGAKIAAARVVAIVVAGHQPSASTQQMVGAGEIARAIRKVDPYRTVVMLGNHPSALPERTLREEPVDYVIDGEGPVSLLGLLRGDPPSTIPGLVWCATYSEAGHHDQRTIVQNPLAPLLEDLDRDLHGDTWDLLPMDNYRAHNWHALTGPRQPYASIYTTLGCPFRCSFCMINAFQHVHRYRRHSPVFVVAQIERLYRDHGVRSLKIADEMFVLNEDHYMGIAERLAAKPWAGEMNIWAYARVDTVKADTLPLLRRAGIRWLALGIESGSAHVRYGAQKHLRSDDIIGTVQAVQAAGICVIGNYIFGLPDDTMDTMLQTLDLALTCRTEWANFYCAMAYPGSALYDEAIRKGWVLPASFAGYSQHNEWCRPLDTAHIGAREVLKFRDEAFKTYFGSDEYQSMISKRFGDAGLDAVQKMLGYNLKRRLIDGTIS